MFITTKNYAVLEKLVNHFYTKAAREQLTIHENVMVLDAKNALKEVSVNHEKQNAYQREYTKRRHK